MSRSEQLYKVLQQLPLRATGRHVSFRNSRGWRIRSTNRYASVERMWHVYDSQGQTLLSGENPQDLLSCSLFAVGVYAVKQKGDEWLVGSDTTVLLVTRLAC